MGPNMIVIKLLLDELFDNDLIYSGKVKMFLSDELGDLEREQFMYMIVNYFQRDLKEKIKFNYLIDENSFGEIQRMKKWDKDNNRMTMVEIRV